MSGNISGCKIPAFRWGFEYCLCVCVRVYVLIDIKYAKLSVSFVKGREAYFLYISEKCFCILPALI